MTIIQLNPEALPLLSHPLPLGIRGENEVTQVVFDVSAWVAAYGDGVVQLQVRRPGDSAAYPVTLTRSGNDAIWTLSSTDLAVRGECKAEYIYTVGTAVKKSCVLYYYVQTDIGDGGPAPDPYEDWLETLEELAAQTEQNAADAEAASQAIQNMSVSGTALQPGATPTVTKTVDPETGAVTLTFGLVPGATGPQGQAGADGVSPEVTITEITGGHSVTITDKDHPGGQSFDVMDGVDGAPGQDGADGVSPEVTITEITGGHSVTITDAEHPGGQSFDVMNGVDGAPGQDGATGPQGPAGQGVPAGGTTGQVLKKKSATDYDTEWADESGGGGGGAVDSVNGKTGVVVLDASDVGAAASGLGIAGASVGDLIKVAAVDGSGRPTAWTKAADGTDYQAPVEIVRLTA